MKKILFIPSAASGCGTGHLKRCVNYALSSFYDGFIYIPADINEYVSEIISNAQKHGRVTDKITGFWDMIVFDMRKTPASLFEKCRSLTSITAGIDEGGSRRADFDYLIDTMPNLIKGTPANYTSTGLLCSADERNKQKYRQIDQYRKIIITFGGEDRADLTAAFLHNAVIEGVFCSSMEITVVKGALYSDKSGIMQKVPSFFRVMDSQKNLIPFLRENDLVITLFGLTAFEALYLGCHVILLNPTEYHKKLSKKAGLPDIGVLKPDIRKFRKMLADPGKYNNRIIENLPAPQDLPELLDSINMPDLPGCRICGKKESLLKRFEKKNYYFCSFCRNVSIRHIIGFSEKNYGRNYFFDEYKKQYGKTYLEDFENIERISDKRINCILKLTAGRKLLDAGCAFGPFLLSALKHGFECRGLDISNNAVDYVKNNLKIDSFCDNFAESSNPLWFKEKSLDVITMWFVIEHFSNPGEVIKKVSYMLRDKGVFAFSTPNLKGISSITDMEKFLRSSPEDHFTVWSIPAAKNILKKNNFKVKKTRVTGHHPERFPVTLQKIFGRKALNLISRFFRLGDTFEIYAVKAGINEN